MKKFDPELLPLEFGKALARLSDKSFGGNKSESYSEKLSNLYSLDHFENLRWLSDIALSQVKEPLTMCRDVCEEN